MKPQGDYFTRVNLVHQMISIVTSLASAPKTSVLTALGGLSAGIFRAEFWKLGSRAQRQNFIEFDGVRCASHSMLVTPTHSRRGACGWLSVYI